MPKEKRARDTGRTLGLADQIAMSRSAPRAPRAPRPERARPEDAFVDDALTAKILQQAREQQQEEEEEEQQGEEGETGQEGARVGRRSSAKITRLGAAVRDGGSGSSDDEEQEEEADEEWPSLSQSAALARGTGGHPYECVEVDAEDERAIEMFMNKNPPARQTLADIIMEKITEKQTEVASALSEATGRPMPALDPRVLEVYKGVREILTKYRSGKLPKAFKIIPALSNWEQILYVTEPESWSAAAVYQATRIFTSNLKERMAQRFFNLVLLPRVRDDIAEYKRLNFHLYMALKKALFKPGAWFKGILLPLCESGTCTLREAIIVGSILSKSSIPVLHSSAALLKIAEMEYSGANSVFLRLFLDKKYALPYRVLDALVCHFLRFRADRRTLPVLWHQALLVLTQRYKEDLSSEQKEALLELIKVHGHPAVTGEVRRELQHSASRDVEMMQLPPMTDGTAMLE
ncbi:unnamed protein product [Lampetra planeri]